MEGKEAKAAERTLSEITDDLVDMLSEKRRRWAAIYELMEEVERKAMWKPEYFSLTRWIEDLARRAHCQVQYLWRVKKAGRFYVQWEEERKRAGKPVPPLEDCPLGDEMLADIDRLTEGNPKRAELYLSAAMNGSLSKKRVKQLVRETKERRAGNRKRRKNAMWQDWSALSADADQGGATDDGASAAGAVTADAVIMGLRPTLFHDRFDLSCPLQAGERRVWQVLTEFPVKTGSTAHARRMDALCISNAGTSAANQYDVVLDSVEVKVALSDLTRDTKHLEYEIYADRCWFAVPVDLEDKALELAPDGWGVLVLDGESELRVARKAQLKRGDMRGVTLATALVKTLPTMSKSYTEVSLGYTRV